MAATQLYWEDVRDGQDVPPYSQKVGYMELNRFAGANNELVPIHMDPDYAKNVANLPDVIVMGNLKLAYIANALTDWAGDVANGGPFARRGDLQVATCIAWWQARGDPSASSGQALRSPLHVRLDR